VRSEDLDYLDEMLNRVKQCADAAALATGCSVEMRMSNPSYLPQKHNPTLAETFQKNIEFLSASISPPSTPLHAICTPIFTGVNFDSW
jgi:metal-dependent amidase/aminoacylase/carboxypeptidase family protein